jgi:hypothetical protein
MGPGIYLCTYDLYGPVLNVFDACRSITRQGGGGWVLEIDTFLGPEMALASLVAISGPKKVDLHASKTLRTGPNES